MFAAQACRYAEPLETSKPVAGKACRERRDSSFLLNVKYRNSAILLAVRFDEEILGGYVKSRFSVAHRTRGGN